MFKACVPAKKNYTYLRVTWRDIPEGSNLRSHCCENLKSHDTKVTFLRQFVPIVSLNNPGYIRNSVKTTNIFNSNQHIFSSS
jgi:hypothetical protein